MTSTKVTRKPAGQNTQLMPSLYWKLAKIKSLNWKKPTNKKALMRVSAVFFKRILQQSAHAKVWW
jgi:hypothetical protein|uniref:hypothetical protein n=1 Tax=Limnohabitans sp. TaxID=1907725 RepID=UPI004048A08A